MSKGFVTDEKFDSYVIATFLLLLQSLIMNVSAEVECKFFDSAIVNDTIIRLGDIASLSGIPEGISLEELKKIDVGEAAPAGYSRFINADDIFRHNSLKIKYVNNDNQRKRISIRTDFQEVSLSLYETEIAHYIKSKVNWPDGDYQLKINNINQKWKCLKKPFSTNIEGLSSNYPKGNFNCKFIINQGVKHFEGPISCNISVITPVVVSNAKIVRGTHLSVENCHIEKMDITHFNYLPYFTLKEIENKLISRSVNSGVIIHEKMTTQIPLVQRDEIVRLVAIKGKIMACVDAKARESGILGNIILVENEMTHKLLKAKVIKRGEVAVFYGDGDI